VLARFSMDDRRSLNRPPLIIAADGTWHRPMTTLELAALQDFPVTVGGEWLELDGRSHKRWREAIGNAVPRAAARAMGAEALRCLIASDLGVWAPGGSGVWVERREESTSCPA
jgi:hypothetical protein